MDRPLRLGTRGSPLAMAQARMTAEALRTAHRLAEDAIEIVPLVASGDRILDRPLAEVGGKALWTRELDRALLAHEIDLAVHSMKDVETERPATITLAAMLPRADVRDRLVGAASLEALPSGARLGTSSPRRAAQVRALRPDVEAVLFRGNVATRLAKLERGEADATLLAAAGLDRLGHPEIGAAIPVATMLPAASQGAVGIEARSDDPATLGLLAGIDHHRTHRCVTAERAFLAALGADCRSPVAALAVWDGERLHLRAEILSPDGAERYGGEAVFADGEDAPAGLARDLLGRASPALRELFA